MELNTMTIDVTFRDGAWIRNQKQIVDKVIRNHFTVRANKSYSAFI